MPGLSPIREAKRARGERSDVSKFVIHHPDYVKNKSKFYMWTNSDGEIVVGGASGSVYKFFEHIQGHGEINNVARLVKHYGVEPSYPNGTPFPHDMGSVRIFDSKSVGAQQLAAVLLATVLLETQMMLCVSDGLPQALSKAFMDNKEQELPRNADCFVRKSILQPPNPP